MGMNLSKYKIVFKNWKTNMVRIEEVIKNLGMCKTCGILQYKPISAKFGKCAACGATE